MKAKGFTKETISSLGIYERKIPFFDVGDTVAVSQWIKEGDKKRLQIFEGFVLKIHGSGASKTFTVRKIGANSIPVERIFPYYSPLIESIAFVSKGRVRRANLWYMRERTGKSARVQERVMTRQQKDQMARAHERSDAAVTKSDE
jgi:large subunit ribosomal protein L19